MPPPPEDPTVCWGSSSSYGSADNGNTFIGQVRAGRKIRLTVTGPAGTASSEGVTETSVHFPHFIAGDYTVRVEDLDQPGCVVTETVDIPLLVGVETNDCESCLSFGGTAASLASFSKDANGNMQGSASYWVAGCPGQKVRIRVKGSDGWSGSAEADSLRAVVTRPVGMESGEDTITVENLSYPDCSRTFTMSFGPPPGLEGVEGNDCESCLSIGGGETASLVPTASGLVAQWGATYWVEGCPGQKVRIRAEGSDGWSGSAEGDNQRAEITRPAGTASGKDTITVENLSIPNCSRTFTRSFGPPSGDLKGAEAAAGEGSASAKGTRTLDGLVGVKSGRAEQKAADGLSLMGSHQGMQEASNVGNETLRSAKQTVDSGGQAAQTVRDQSQRKIRGEDAQASQVLATAIIEGVGAGLAQAGGQLGTGLGEGVAGEIFNSRSSKPTEGGDASSGTTTAASPSSSKGASSGKSGHSTPKTKPASGKTSPSSTPPAAPPSPPPTTATTGQQIFIDALCPICGEMYNPNDGHQCRGAPEPPKTACDLCGKSPAGAVSTLEEGTKMMCSSCQSEHRCTKCGKITMSPCAEGYSYSFLNPDGTTTHRSGSISRVCAGCLAKWKAEHGVP